MNSKVYTEQELLSAIFGEKADLSNKVPENTKIDNNSIIDDEIKSSEKKLQKSYINRIDTQTNSLKDENKRRERIRIYTQNLISCYLKTIFTFIVINPFIFKYSETVIVTLITTTTVSILGIFKIVVEGVYKK